MNARDVGVEIEFGALSPRLAAALLSDTLSGTVVEDNAHSFQLIGSSAGDLTIELDIRYLHPVKYGDTLRFALSKRHAELIGRAAGWAVPTELITGPLPRHRLAHVDRVVAELRRAGAAGTGDFSFRSYGLHFNVTVPSMEASIATDMLKAYILLEDWLRIGVLGRRSSRLPGLAPPFPSAFARKVVDPDYRPAFGALIGDYISANPTRRRGLDLLPLFMHIDEERIRAALPWEKIRKRPAFHYRLPLARIDRPDWSILPDWQRWREVERLADDPARLQALARDYTAFDGTSAQWAALSAPPTAE